MDEMDPRRFGNLLHECLKDFAKLGPVVSVDAGEVRRFLSDQLKAQSIRFFGAGPLRMRPEVS